MDLPGGVKLHQDRVFALHEGLEVAVSEDRHAVLFFHLGVIYVFFLLLVITFLSSLLLFFINW